MVNIFEQGELEKKSTVSKLEIVQKEGKREIKRIIEFYNLDVIIAIGYWVNSIRATQFRIWSTKILKEYIIKGSPSESEITEIVDGLGFEFGGKA